jgi:pimeloyl-ACP methyl ester carboxylesterase
VAVDDVGDPAGVVVVYLHGTPDSRLSRHPDDALAARAGVRLLALDRPGYGRTSPLPLAVPPGPGPGPATNPDSARAAPTTAGPTTSGPTTSGPTTSGPTTSGPTTSGPTTSGPAPWPPSDDGVAGDVAAVLDALGVDRCAVLAWSGGALDALTVTAALADRVAVLTIAAGLVPRPAYDDADVRAAAPGRVGLLDLADELPPGELGETVAPMLAPYPCDEALAAEHQQEHRDATSRAEVDGVVGAGAQMARGLVEAVRHGLAGVARDVEQQNRAFPLDLATITAPVLLRWGTDDTTTPPPFGAWYARTLPRAELELTTGAGHHLPLPRWQALLTELAARAGAPS